MQELQAPIYEEKVIDFIVELAEVTDQPMTVEELMADPDETPAGDEDTAESKSKAKAGRGKGSAKKGKGSGDET